MKMVADVYSHIIDDDRRLNAQRFEEAFYSGRRTDDTPVVPISEIPSAATKETDQQILMRLLQNPEMATLLKTLAKSL